MVSGATALQCFSAQPQGLAKNGVANCRKLSHKLVAGAESQNAPFFPNASKQRHWRDAKQEKTLASPKSSC